MKIVVTSESTIDLSKELLEKYNIKTVPFTVLLGETSGFDGDITPNDIFDYVDKTGILPKTSAINIAQYEAFFEEIFKEYDEVIHIGFSSKLSSAYSNLMNVASKNKHIHVIDSLSLSSGIGLLAIYASELIKEGKSVDEIVSLVSLRVPYVQVSSVISTLDYLHKGGRCSALVNKAAQLLRIHPQIVIKDGEITVGKKYLGKQIDCIKKYLEDTLKEFNNPDYSRAILAYTSASEEMIKVAKDKLEEAGFKEILICQAGCTVTSHCGPHVVGIYYINDGNNK